MNPVRRLIDPCGTLARTRIRLQVCVAVLVFMSLAYSCAVFIVPVRVGILLIPTANLLVPWITWGIRMLGSEGTDSKAAPRAFALGFVILVVSTAAVGWADYGLHDFPAHLSQTRTIDAPLVREGAWFCSAFALWSAASIVWGAREVSRGLAGVAA